MFLSLLSLSIIKNYKPLNSEVREKKHLDLVFGNEAFLDVVPANLSINSDFFEV